MYYIWLIVKYVLLAGYVVIFVVTILPMAVMSLIEKILEMVDTQCWYRYKLRQLNNCAQGNCDGCNKCNKEDKSCLNG